MSMYQVKAKVQLEVEIIVNRPEVKTKEQAAQVARDYARNSLNTDFNGIDFNTATPIASDTWEIKRLRKN